MGDSSECCNSNNSHVSFPTDIEYMDNVSDSEEEEVVKKSNFNSNHNYKNGDLPFSCRQDVCIQMEDLDAPVPICPDTDASCLDTNVQEEKADDKEPKISTSEALGREANGFDEAAEVEGSEEEVLTGSPSASSEDLWDENNYSADEFDSCLPTSKGTNLMISRGSIYESNVPYKHLRNSSDTCNDKASLFSSNPHRSLYSSTTPQFEMQEFTGRGENSAIFNNAGLSDMDKHILRTTDTYKSSASTSRRPVSSKSEIDKPVTFSTLQSSGGSTHYVRQPTSPRSNVMGFGMNSTVMGMGPANNFISTTRSPRQSSFSPSISGSCSRTMLPYESASATPPLGNPVDVKKVSDTASELLSFKGALCSDEPRDMPHGESIHLNDDNDASGNEVETVKKKKKKKKRNAHKVTEVTEEKKPSRMPDSAVTTPYTTYNADMSSSVMEQSHRLKVKQSAKNKKKNENKILAKDIDGHRGNEDIDILLHYVEGKKKTNAPTKGKLPAPTNNEQKKKQKKQKVVTRPVTDSAVLEQGKNVPLVMGSVVEENVPSSPEDAKLSNDSSGATVSIVGTPTVYDSCADSLASPKVDGSGDRLTNVSKEEENVDDSRPSESALVEDKVEETKTTVSEEVTDILPCAPELDNKAVEEVETGVVHPEKNKSEQIPHRASDTNTSPQRVSDLEFTNFEGLVDYCCEQPFEKYVGRKKKQRQQQTPQQYRQQQGPNSSFSASRGRWSANQTNPPPSSSSGRIHHGNGYNHSSSQPHVPAGAHKTPSQVANRYPPANPSSQSFAAKASSSSRVPQQQSLANDPRKTTGQHPRSPPSSATPPGVKSPPPREEFPPLRPTPETQAVKKETSLATSASTTSSLVPGKNGNTDGGKSASVAAGDREPSKVSECRSAVAAPSGDRRDKEIADLITVQQFIEMLYPKQNEPCYFYSENAKRQHFLQFSSAKKSLD